MSDLTLEPLDSSLPGQGKASQDDVGYDGVERRHGRDRREGGDRREQVRFDAHGGDRRSGKDRRRHDSWVGSRNDRW